VEGGKRDRHDAPGGLWVELPLAGVWMVSLLFLSWWEWILATVGFFAFLHSRGWTRADGADGDP
jgi:hypothetical protein